MSKDFHPGPSEHDDVVGRVAERMAAEIAAQIERHLADRQPEPPPRPELPRPGVHTMPRTRPTVFRTEFRGPVFAGAIHTGHSADLELARAEQALHTVLSRLADARLPRRSERAVRKQATVALTEVQRLVQPQPGQLRRVLHPVMTALISASAGAASPVIHELVQGLQHAVL